MRLHPGSAKWMLACLLVLGQAAGPAVRAGTAEAPDAGLPAVPVPVCDAAPYLDGLLTDACWQAATVLSNFAVLGAEGRTAGHAARLTRDGQWLYVAVSIAHPDPAHIKQAVYESDGSVQADDALELYLEPGSSNAFYLHYALNAGNIKGDQLILRNGSRDRNARMPWRSATARTDTGWTAELAIPFHVALSGTQFYKTANMKVCDWSAARFNLCVNVVKPLLDPYGALVSEEKQCSAWCGGHHQPDEWAFLTGIQPDPTPAPARKATAPLFWPILETVRVGHYEIQDGQPGYELGVLLKNTAYGGGTAEVLAWDRPVAGDASRAGTTAVFRATGREQTADLALRVPLKTPGRRTVLVRLDDALRGGTFETRLLDEQTLQATDPFAVWLDRSYYTTEREAQVVCRLRMPEPMLAGQCVVIKDQAGAVVGRLDALTPRCAAPVALASFAPGRHPLTVEWQDAAGRPQADLALALVKREPRPGREVKVDALNGVVLKDGAPIFPFGLLASDLTSQDEAYFQRMAEAGFNTVAWWGRDPATSSEEYNAWLRTAGKFGLNVLDSPHGTQPIPPYMSSFRKTYGKKVYDRPSFSKEEELAIAIEDLEGVLPDLRRTWALSLDHSNVIAHYSIDEPNLVNPEARITAAERLYRELRLADPYRPILMAYACHIPAGSMWTSWSDVLAYNPYIYPGWGRLQSCSPNYVSQQALELVQRAGSVHQPVWLVPVAFQMDPERTPRGLTPAEQYCQTYLALIHGAKGLLYFVNNQVYAQSAWDALCGLGRQMTVLGPALVAPPVPQEVTYADRPLVPEKGAFPDVQAALVRHPDGRPILLAANSVAWPVTAEFAVSGTQAPGSDGSPAAVRSVKNLFGADTHTAGAQGFRDEFEGFGVRAYALDLGASADPASVIRIAVQASPHPERGPAETPFPVGAIMKRKNKMPNPSLEIATIPGVPDYIKPNMFLDWPLAGSPDAWGLDTREPYHGAHCLRLINRFKGGEAGPNYRITCGAGYVPALSAPTAYTFSVYARAAREGEVLKLLVPGMAPDSPGPWTLTREWQRFSHTGTFTSGGVKTVYLYTAHKDAVLYVDALQLEAGDTPTDFTAE